MHGINDVEAGKRTDRLDHPGSRGTGERVAFNGDLPGDGVVTGSVTGLRHTRHHLQLAPHLPRRGVSHPPGAGVTAQNRKSPLRPFFSLQRAFCFVPSPRHHVLFHHVSIRLRRGFRCGDGYGDGVVLGPPNPSPRALPDTGASPQRASSSASHLPTRPSPWYHAPFLVRSFLKRLPIFIPKVVPLSKWRMLLAFPQVV